MAITEQQPFRFMDLPPELRCMVYERIDVLTTWHTLDRIDAHAEKSEWPVPPKAQINESRIALIIPHTPLDILMVCRLTNLEARPFLERKMGYCKAQPTRFLVDYSAACALLRPCSTFNSCLGIEGRGPEGCRSGYAKDFLQLCSPHVSHSPRKDGSRDVRTIELTIAHKRDIEYCLEVYAVMSRVTQIKHCSRLRLVVTYNSSLPRVRHYTYTSDSKIAEAQLLEKVPREPEDTEQVSSQCGVFVRPLENEAFEKHVEALERY
jgi:hypothetical protein